MQLPRVIKPLTITVRLMKSDCAEAVPLPLLPPDEDFACNAVTRGASRSELITDSSSAADSDPRLW